MSRLPLSLIVVVMTGWACGGSSSEPPPSGNPSQGTPKEIAPAADGEWYRKAVFYEVFVRSFQDSDGDGKGDLKGLISRLDYLNDGDPNTTQDLGVDALWLMPIFASPSYHGYDVVDYERINPDYGTEEDFEKLCAEAHRRGIRIILDFVINHTGVDHPWFVESASSPTSPKRDWYVWREQDPGWRQPWDIFSNTPTWYPRNGAYYYGLFWSGMPDLNLRNAEVRAEMKRLASLWLARGADGFRLDAARYLIETGAGGGQADTYETHAYWKEFAAHVRQQKPGAVLAGESWTSTTLIATYYGSTKDVPGGDELQLNFNFPLSEQILAGVKAGNATPIASKLADVASSYPAGVSDAPFLTNHDMRRVASQFGGNAGMLANVSALLLTLPGAPFLYYGEELGMVNGTGSGDEAKRTPMSWDGSEGGGFTTGKPWYGLSRDSAAGRSVVAETGDPGSLLSRYRTLIGVRHASEALSRGGLKILSPTQKTSVTLAFVRTLGEERVLVVHNISDYTADAGPYALEGTTPEVLFADSGVRELARSTSGWQVSLPPRTTGVWRIKP